MTPASLHLNQRRPLCVYLPKPRDRCLLSLNYPWPNTHPKHLEVILLVRDSVNVNCKIIQILPVLQLWSAEWMDHRLARSTQRNQGVHCVARTEKCI